MDWWRKSVVYQIYPRSFSDSNGDGIGDLNGIASKLDYLKTLGADVLWLSPVYQSPGRDNGYDVSDYEAINPAFGTMADFDALLAKAHGLGLKIVMDLVVNHTSDEHAWFAESRQSRDNPKRGYYIWRDGANGGPPNDWRAAFGGPAWTLDERTGQYYLHMFSPYQPDLNWENPELRESVYAMMCRWLDKGVDGFRMDVISLLSKPLDFPDGDMFPLVANGPREHEFLREMNREVLSKYDVMTVGEAACVTLEEAVKYASADGAELNMVFHFEHMGLDDGQYGKWTDKKIPLPALKATLTRWQKGLYQKAWNSLYFCNHDQPRIVSRLGDDGAYREKSAKILATCLHFMQGTPYIYQGEELGMTNAPFASIDDYRDLESINAYHELAVQTDRVDGADMLRYLQRKSRDNARTPMQWRDAANAGFTSGEPWIMVNPNYTAINAEEQAARADSVFAYYKELIRLRHEMDIITLGDFELLLPEDADIFAYTRTYGQEALLVVCNFARAERAFDLPGRFKGVKPLIANRDGIGGTLQPFDAAVYHIGGAGA